MTNAWTLILFWTFFFEMKNFWILLNTKFLRLFVFFNRSENLVVLE